MKKTIEERTEYAKIIAQAWVDEEFKERLLSDPATVLMEYGIEVPESMSVKFVEQKENEILVPLPPPHPALEELSDDSLDKVVGGTIKTTRATNL